MRIGVDMTTWANWRGYGRFTRSLIGALLEIDRANDYVLFFDAPSYGTIPPPRGGRHVVVRTKTEQGPSASGRRRLYDLARMTAAVHREPLDVFFFPSVYSFFPLLGRPRTLVVVHDTIAEAHPELIFPGRRARLFWDLKVRLALFQADRVVTVSEHARRDVHRHFGLAEERIAIIPEAPAGIFRPPTSRAAARVCAQRRHGLSTPYLLYVGGFGPHKNVAGLVDAFADLIEEPRSSDLVLLLVGKRRGDEFYSTADDLEGHIRRRSLETRVRFLDFQPDESLVLLYQGAEALVLPSVREGFGLPGIEAAACGTPVVATRRSALPDVLGDAAIYVDPEHPPSLLGALRSVLGDPETRRRMDRARERIHELSWQRSAERAIEIFTEMRPKG